MSEQVMSDGAKAAADAAPKAIVTPLIDALAIGGLSLIVLPAVFFLWPDWYGGGSLEPPLRPVLDHVGELFIIGTALLNWPHFMSTYGLLYRSKESVTRYPVATIWMPLLLAIYCVGATIAGKWTPIPARLAGFVAGAYLAWHYTGQAWGMMATFTFMEKKSFPDDVRTTLRLSLRFLLAFHVGWFVYYLEPFGIISLVDEETARTAYVAFSAATLGIAAILGIKGTIGYVRHNQGMPARVGVAWGGIWAWYIFMFVHPIAIFWVQLAHSIQYLIFPARIEANRARARNNRWPTAALYATAAALWIAAGLFVFRGGPFIVNLLDGLAGGAGGTPVPTGERSMIDPGIAFLSLGAFINIHHYFADSVIWRISNPSVRKELFAHLAPKKA